MSAQFMFSNRLRTRRIYFGFNGDGSGLDSGPLFTVAYLAAEADAPDFTLSNAWHRDDGCIVVMGEIVQDADRLEAGLLALPGIATTRLLWIANPTAPADQWSMTAFEFSAVDGGERRTVQAGALHVTTDQEGYGISFSEGCVAGVDETASLIWLRRGDEHSSLAFGCGGLNREVTAGGVCLKLDVSAGVTASLGFTLPGGVDLTDWFDALDIGLRYSSAHDDSIESVRFPVFSPHAALPALTIDATLTLPSLLDPRLTRLAASLEPRTSFTSWFRTVDGRACRLTTSSLAFAFAPRPSRRAQRRLERLTLVPVASFELIVSAQRPDEALAAHSAIEELALFDHDQLLCGTSGGEYIGLPKVLTDYVMEFVPGCPAFSLQAGDGASGTLTDEATTAWIRISSASSALPYYSQPEGEGTFFQAQDTVALAEVPLLPYYPMVAGTLGAAADAPLLPMVPLAGVTQADAAIRTELTAIAPARAEVIAGLGRGTRRTGQFVETLADEPIGSSHQITAVTPRGLIGEFSESATGERTWDAVRIAQLLAPNSGELKLTGAPGVGITEPLLSALLANQQFVVISDPVVIERFLNPTAPVELAGWKFDLDPASWAAHGTIMVLKNASSSFRDLAFDTNTWTSARSFNRDVVVTAQRLRRIIEDAERQVAVDRAADEGARTSLDYFVDTVLRSADWNGYLFLDVTVSEAPSTLAGLRAGINGTGFVGHHLGVTQTIFTGVADLLTQETAMFGRIVYEGRPATAPPGAFDFTVESMDVLFHDSLVRDFRSTIALQPGRILGQVPLASGGRSPVIRMRGSHQRRGDTDTFMFSTDDELSLEFGAGALRSAKIVQGEFETMSQDAGAGRATLARFSLAGWFELADVGPTPQGEDFDILSFSELGFSGLAVDMHFTDNPITPPTFSISLEQTQLVAARTRARPGSLFEGFPVRLGRLVAGAADAPGRLGFMTVTMPLDVVKLPAQWFGVELLFEMGSLSDLAGAASLEASLLLAWGPRDREVLVGLKLPGSGSSSAELSLLGVLKLSIYSLEVRHVGGIWALLLNGMRLNVFGKQMPADGTFAFYLFGQPDVGESAANLGWYGAYSREDDSKKAPTLALPEGQFEASAESPAALAPTIRRRGERTTNNGRTT